MTRTHHVEHWYEHGPMRAPGVLRLALEWRAPWEYGASLLLRPLLDQAPRGDGHPVLLFPGLLASDRTTAPLRGYLESLGYVPYGWGLGANKGPREGVMDACRARLAQIHKRHKRRVSLVGWSLGGIYAREFAKETPKAVRLVITLGTPFTGHPKATNAWRVYEKVTGHRIGTADLHEPLRVPPQLPTTSIYSRSDGIVSWQCSVEKTGPLHENIEVEASHLGLGFNPLAWYAIADRLAQPEGAWKPFDRAGVRAWLFRDPKRAGWF
ncbi:MAG: esterase/lipase family protein [Burkholderiales bacterium]